MKRSRQWIFDPVQVETNKIVSTNHSTMRLRLQHKNRQGVRIMLSRILLILLPFGSNLYVVSQTDNNSSSLATDLPVPRNETTGTPSFRASSSEQPSVVPTAIRTPTLAPTTSLRPTRSSLPSTVPTITLSNPPTAVASDMPSNFPTLPFESISRSRFRQTFEVPARERFFNATLFSRVVESYTDRFAPVSDIALLEITTLCIVNGQSGNLQVINKSDTFINEVDYTCSYSSTRTQVTNFTDYFVSYVNSDLDGFTEDLRSEGIQVNESQEVLKRQVQSPAPSVSMQPSSLPSSGPTTKNSPTIKPTGYPTVAVVSIPTGAPTFKEITWAPSAAPDPKEKERKLNVFVVAGIVIFTGGGLLGLLLWYYVSWRRKQLLLLGLGRLPPSAPPSNGPVTNDSGRLSASPATQIDEAARNDTISPTESLLSNKSLLSAGESPLAEGSRDEFDGTNDLQDEFDKYKDQNLEQFRVGVECKVAGLESVISAAVTMAHMVDDQATLDEAELRWNCDENYSGIDIEATALYEVSDWLKRNETAPPERRRAFMEDILNKMVASVKNGILNADDGSRTIHESAAILGLDMADALPMTTVIISGMRKTATAEDLSRTLREFGDVDVAAVASGYRGFGIVRFRRPKSVERAMRRYNAGEIVVQDVAVQMKVLMPNGVVDSRAPPELLQN